MKELIKKLLRESILREITIQDAWKSYYSDAEKYPVLNNNEELFNQLNDLYPRRGDNFNKGYFTWLYNLIKNNRLKTEDFYKVKEYLRLFEKFKNRIPTENRDINKYASINDLFDVVKDFESDEDSIATSKTSEIKNIKKNEIDKVYEDEGWLIMIPRTERASCLIGKGTQWCTAADRSDNRFESHNSQGPLYVIVDKDEGDKYQLHIESNQFMDANDREVDPSYFFDDYSRSGIMEYFQTHLENFWEFILKNSVQDMANQRDSYYSETFQEALNNANPESYDYTEALNILRDGYNSTAVYEGFMNETDPDNIEGRHIENLIDISENGDSEDLNINEVFNHLIKIGYDFEKMDEEDLIDIKNRILYLIKYNLEVNKEYELDNGGTLKINHVNKYPEEKDYNITMNDNTGDVNLQQLIDYLHQGQLFESKSKITFLLRKKLKKYLFN